MSSELQNPTLKGEAELILRDISGNSITSDRAIDIREIQDKIRATMNELLNLEIFEKKQEGDRTAVTHYIATYPLTVQINEDDEPYFIIPDLYINLPNNEDIHNLYKKGKPRDGFIIDNNPSVGSEIFAGSMLGRKGFYVEGFTGKFMDEECVKKDDKLTIQLIIAVPNNLKETDRLPLIPEQIAQMRRIVKQDILGAVTPEDKVQDGVDNSNPTQANG